MRELIDVDAPTAAPLLRPMRALVRSPVAPVIWLVAVAAVAAELLPIDLLLVLAPSPLISPLPSFRVLPLPLLLPLRLLRLQRPLRERETSSTAAPKMQFPTVR